MICCHKLLLLCAVLEWPDDYFYSSDLFWSNGAVVLIFYVHSSDNSRKFFPGTQVGDDMRALVWLHVEIFAWKEFA